MKVYASKTTLSSSVVLSNCALMMHLAWNLGTLIIKQVLNHAKDEESNTAVIVRKRERIRPLEKWKNLFRHRFSSD